MDLTKMFGISAAHYRLTLSQASSMHCGFNQIEYLDRTRNRSRQIGGSLRHPVERRGPEVRSKGDVAKRLINELL